MLIAALQIKLYAPWANSLKDKRMVVKSLTAKIRNNFNVSVAEVEEQDIIRTIVLGIVFVCASASLADSVTDRLISFIESNCEAEITDIQREIR